MLEERFKAETLETADIVYRREDGWVHAYLVQKPEVVAKSRTWEGALLELLLAKYGLTHFETDIPEMLGENIPGLCKIKEEESELEDAEPSRSRELVTA